MRRTILRLMLAAAFLGAVPASAFAQTVPRQGGSWLYGISFGAGRRTTDAALRPSQLPVAAPAPAASLNVGALDIEGGITLNGRLAVVGLFERRATFGRSDDWGTSGGHAALRGWIVPRVWVEGGVGPMELAYRPNNSHAPTTRWWTAGYEAGGGYEIFQGPTVTLQVFARYTTAVFEGLRINTLTVQFGLLGRR